MVSSLTFGTLNLLIHTIYMYFAWAHQKCCPCCIRHTARLDVWSNAVHPLCHSVLLARDHNTEWRSGLSLFKPSKGSTHDPVCSTPSICWYDAFCCFFHLVNPVRTAQREVEVVG